MKFFELKINQTFDWIDDSKPGYNSFFRPCKKISPRKYIDSDGNIHKVGSINAKVFHIDKFNDIL